MIKINIFSLDLLNNLVVKFLFIWKGEIGYNAAYSGTKGYTQHEVKTANANGFAAAADDYMERGIDLNEQLILNKPATFFFRMNGDVMTGAGINTGDVLVVDEV